MHIDDILMDVLDLHPDERRDAVERICGTDTAMRDRVLRLLELSESDRVKFLDSDPVQPRVGRYMPGDMIGTYRLVRLIGTGGSGVVFEAQQDSPRRPVAIKLLRWGEMSQRFVDRFRAEGNLLGRLVHQGIVTVFESGVDRAEDGWAQPYIAMALVDGMPLHEYVKTSRPSYHQFIAIMIEVCSAVHHAHQLGVIHGDLKPSNILVCADGTAKVIDFGIGRLVNSIDPQSTPAPPEGTRRFISPERLSGTNGYANARSDIYALGVILHYFLTGRFPPDDRAIDPSRWFEMRGVVPGVRIARRDRRHDLGSVVAKAVSPDPLRRYDSAARLAEDLRHLLAMRPVSTQRRTFISAGCLFARRSPVLALLIVVACGLAMTAAGSVAWGFQRAVQSEQEVRRALADANEVAGALREIIVGGRYDTQAGQISVADLLKQGERHVHSLEINSPEVKARLYLTLAEGYDAIGEISRSVTCIENGLEVLDRSGTAARKARIELRNLLGTAHRKLGNPAEALRVHQSLAEDLERQGAELPIVVRARVAVGLNLQQLGKYEQAERTLRDILSVVVDLYGTEHPTTLTVYANLALTLQSMGRAEDAIEFAEVAYRNSDAAWGTQDQRVIQTGNTLAWAYMSADRSDEAVRVLRDLLDLIRERFGSESPYLPQTAYSLAHHYLVEEEYSEMRQVLDENLAAAHHHFAAGSWIRGAYDGLYGLSLVRTGHASDAVPILEDACMTLESVLGAPHRTTQEAIKALAEALAATGDAESAARWELKIRAHAP